MKKILVSLLSLALISGTSSIYASSDNAPEDKTKSKNERVETVKAKLEKVKETKEERLQELREKQAERREALKERLRERLETALSHRFDAMGEWDEDKQLAAYEKMLAKVGELKERKEYTGAKSILLDILETVISDKLEALNMEDDSVDEGTEDDSSVEDDEDSSVEDEDENEDEDEEEEEEDDDNDDDEDSEDDEDDDEDEEDDE